MKILMPLYSVILCIILVLFATDVFCEDWYEVEEASCVASDYIGSDARQITKETVDSKYTPEYSKSDLTQVMIERDLATETSTTSSESSASVVDTDLGARALTVGISPPPEEVMQ